MKSTVSRFQVVEHFGRRLRDGLRYTASPRAETGDRAEVAACRRGSARMTQSWAMRTRVG